MTQTLPIAGPPATDADFFGRDRDIEHLWTVVDRGHLLLLAPRRVGKTSILKRMLREAPSRGFRAEYTSVAGCEDELAFVQTLYAAAVQVDGTILQKVKSHPWSRTLAAWFPAELSAGPVSIRFAEGAASHWPALGEALIRVLSEADHRTLLFVDELPIFLSRVLNAGEAPRARRFLEWFRDVRQRLPNVQWALAGSVGLDAIAEQWNLSATINDLTPTYLGAFSDEEAAAYLRWCAGRAGLSLSDDTLAHLLDRVGWPLPFYLASMFRALVATMPPGSPATPAHVDASFDRLTDVHHRNLYDPWKERLAVQLTPERAARANAVLALAARDPKGVSSRTLAAAGETDPWILAVLEADGYLVPDGDRMRFRSPLLRTYWQRYVVGRFA